MVRFKLSGFFNDALEADFESDKSGSSKLREMHLSIGRKLLKNEALYQLFLPESPLVDIDLREIINKKTFAELAANDQHELVKLLPKGDSVGFSSGEANLCNAFENEYFARALAEFPSRILEGEFTETGQDIIRDMDRNEETLQHRDQNPQNELDTEATGMDDDDEEMDIIENNDTWYGQSVRIMQDQKV